MMIRRILSCVVVILILFGIGSCHSEKEIEIKREMNEYSDYILENITNKQIKLSNKEYSENGIYIELYGSQSRVDIEDLITICNEWVAENQDAILVCEGKKIRIEMYNEKPDNGDRESSAYAVCISNYGIDIAKEPSDCLDVLEIHKCDEFYTSFFESSDMSYRAITLPSNTIIDDFDVFMSMNDLLVLEFSDHPYDNDKERLEAIRQELDVYATNYDSIPFEYDIDVSY